MSTLNVAAIQDVAGSGSKATLPTAGSNFTLGPGWGALEFVSTAGLTTAALVSITGIAAGYDYVVQFEGICPTTDANTLVMRVSDDAGSSYEAGASDYEWTVGDNNASDVADSEIEFIASTNIGNDSGNRGNYLVTIINPGSSSFETDVYGETYYDNKAATPIRKSNHFAGTYVAATSAINAVQFGWLTNYGTNTFKAQGNVTVWRRRRS
jgi:hypothetical protein